MTFESERLAMNYIEEQIEKLQKRNHYSASGKRYAYERAIEVIHEYHLERFYKIDSSKQYWQDRLIKVLYEEQEQVEPSSQSGCYLLGNTAFNPYTEEKFYWVKIGMSSNMQKRIKSYSTYSPTVFKIDFIELPLCCVREKEFWYQLTLSSIGKQAKDSQEWFQVNEKDYLEICSRGFHYFEKNKK